MHLRSGFPLHSFAEVHGNKNVEACAHCGKAYYRPFTVRKFVVEKKLITERRYGITRLLLTHLKM
jgi:hypothetical protein